MSNTNILYSQIYRRIDKARVRTDIPEDVKLAPVSFYNRQPHKTQMRAGILPYTIYQNRLYFGFGIDNQTSDLTDFGGGVQIKDNDPINAAIREFREESLGVFEPLWSNDLNGQYIIYNNKTLIVLLYCGDVNPLEITQTFNNKVTARSEVKGIIWLSAEALRDSLDNYGYRIYSRVRNLLKSPIVYQTLVPTLLK